MASLWKDSRTPYFVACFTAIVGNRRAQWKRSTFVLTKGIRPGEARANEKLAGRVADELEDAAQGRRNPEDVKTFLRGLSDLRTRRGLERVFDKVMKTTTGNGLGGC